MNHDLPTNNLIHSFCYDLATNHLIHFFPSPTEFSCQVTCKFNALFSYFFSIKVHVFLGKKTWIITLSAGKLKVDLIHFGFIVSLKYVCPACYIIALIKHESSMFQIAIIILLFTFNSLYA